MLAALQAEIKTLAAKARILRHAERKAICDATALRLRQRMEAGGVPPRTAQRIINRVRSRGVPVPHLRQAQDIPGGEVYSRVDRDRAETDGPYIAGHDSKAATLHALRTARLQVLPDLVARAEKIGWHSRDMWIGKPSAWLPADKYLEYHGHAAKRDTSVRAEARHHLLAYGFFRGRHLKEMEALSYSPPDLERVRDIVDRYAEDDPRLIAQRFAAWRDSAGTWIHPDRVEAALDAAEYRGADHGGDK